MDMITGLSIITSEWPHKNRWTKRSRYGAILANGFRIGKKSIAHAINIRRRAPRMNTFRATDLMCRRAITAICADEHRRLDFTPKVFQEPGKQKDCAGNVMRKLS